jgi:hypothetical protein
MNYSLRVETSQNMIPGYLERKAVLLELALKRKILYVKA